MATWCRFVLCECFFASYFLKLQHRVGQKTGLFLRVSNFATVGGRNACDMSKFSKFYLEFNIKLAYQCVKYSSPNLHKYSMSLKLR